MRTPSRSSALVVLFLSACTSGDPASSDQEGSVATPAAEGESASSTAESSTPTGDQALDLTDLDGVWVRDDGPRYQLVVDEGRVLALRIDDEAAADERGCRIALAAQGELLTGRACFTRRADEDGLLATRWELRQEEPEVLVGRMEGVDLDEDDQELARVWEPHRLRREAPLAGDELEAARLCLRAQLAIDEALAAGGDLAAIRELVFESPHVRALEREVPGRERVGARLQLLLARLNGVGPGSVSAGAARPRSTDAGSAETEAGHTDAGEEPGMTEVSLAPWVPLSIQARADAELVGSEGAVSIDCGPGFSLNVVEDAECGFGPDMIPAPFRDQVREVVSQSADEVLYAQEIEGERGFALELRVKLGGRVYHAFTDRFTVFEREQVDAMLAAARSLQLLPGTEAAPEAPTAAPARTKDGQPDMPGFLALFDGTCQGVEAALNAYGVPGLQRQNMDWFDLREPQVVKEEADGARVRVTLDAKAGITVRTYALVWEGGQIVEVVELGLR